jgi:uncharacterized delta-60 repeat protein
MKKKELFSRINMLTGVCMLSTTIFAQNAGEIDVTFGVNGYTYTDHVIGVHEMYKNIITLADDKIVAVGYTSEANQNVILTKYDANGIPDLSFGNNGLAIYDLSIGGDEQAFSVKELYDGKMLVVGVIEGMTSNNGFLMRVEANGDLDLSFGTNGYVMFNSGANTFAVGFDLHVNQDNSIYVGASVLNANANADFAIFKFTQGGGLDLSFAASGSNVFDFGADEILMSMDVDANGNIFLAGIKDDGATTNGLLVKLNSYGLIENSFNGTGMIEYQNAMQDHYFNDVKAVGTNKVLVVGYEGTGADIDGILLMYNGDGTPDNSFSSDGKQVSDIGMSNGVYLHRIELLSDGRILTTGHVAGLSMFGMYALVLFDDGNPDFDFAPGGDEIYDFPIHVDNVMMEGMALQSDNKIIVAGIVQSDDLPEVNLMMTRIHLEDAVGLSSEMKSNLVVYPNPTQTSFSIQSDVFIQHVKLSDLSGRIVQQWDVNQQIYLFDQHLPDGDYMLTIQTVNGTSVQKLMKH